MGGIQRRRICREADRRLALTDAAIRNAKPGEKALKLADGAGMLLLATTAYPGGLSPVSVQTRGRCGVDGLPACSASGGAGISLNGAVPGLKPQKSESWSVGFDFRPIDEVTLGASYYRIDMDGTLGSPSPTRSCEWQVFREPDREQVRQFSPSVSA